MNKQAFYRLLNLGVLLSFLSGTCQGYSVKAEIKCSDDPIDLVFVLDASTSIYAPNFQKELNFVKYMIDHLNIGMGPKQVRIGVETFSDFTVPKVHLSDSKDRATLKRKIDQIDYQTGSTNIGDALRMLLLEMFTRKRGSREHVKRVAIILTDGKSQDKEATQEAAKACRDSNIDLFVLGIGIYFDKDELRNIASLPKSKFYHETANFDTLNLIREDILRKTCITVSECDDTRKTDVVFMVSNNHFGKWKTDRILKASKKVMSNVKPNKMIRFGVIYDKCLTDQDVQVGESQITNFNYGSIGSLVNKLNADSFSNARTRTRQVGLLFLDGTIDLKQPDLLTEAKQTLFRDIDLFVVIIGEGVDKRLVEQIVKSKEYIININSYNHLMSDLSSQFDETLCKTIEKNSTIMPVR